MSLVSDDAACPDLKSLPCITEPKGKIEVLAPGSIYQPLLLKPRKEGIEIGPGKLDENEEKFIRDLLQYLYPTGNYPRDDKTPLIWAGKQLWLKRNIEKDTRSFRLRVDDSDWFYPDFILWILDQEAKTQIIGFVDPKGMAVGAAGGWSDYKIVSTVYAPYVVEKQLEAAGLPFEWEGELWTLSIRGVLLSTSSLEVLRSHSKFRLQNEKGSNAEPTEADFERARIVFSKQDRTHIPTILKLLTQNTAMDRIIQAAANAIDASDLFSPYDEIEFDIALRVREGSNSTSEFIEALLHDYLKQDTAGNHGTWARECRRNELLKLFPDNTADFVNHPAPCQELWRRMQEQ